MRKTILVIENDARISASLPALLDGCNVVTTRNGYEALEWVQYGNHAHLLVVNADIQVLNPFDFKECICKLNGMMNLPVIYISNRETVEQYAVAGKDVFLRKPVNINELVQTIHTLLRLQESTTN